MDELEFTLYDSEQLLNELITDELLTPQFIINGKQCIPIFGDLQKENSWQKILKNRH